MTSPSRAIAVLGLFSRQRPIWHTDEINETLAYSRATGYRYVKDLVDAGLLQKVSAGRYALGARIIELDFQLRQSDPVLLAAAPVMDALAARSKLDVVLSSMFGGMQVVDTHRSSSGSSLHLQYGRGRPRPLFRGAAPKVIMAYLPRAPLLRIYESHANEIATAGLGATWAEFRHSMAEIRRAGVYMSVGELDQGVSAAAVPLLSVEGEVIAALALVGTTQQLAEHGIERYQNWLEKAAKAIQTRLSEAEDASLRKA